MHSYQTATKRALNIAIVNSRRLAILIVGLLFWASGSLAQDQEMSVKELEAYIAEQRAALEQVIENRDATEKQAMDIKKAGDEQRERQAKLEEEIRALCEEQEEVEPGTLDECLQGASN